MTYRNPQTGQFETEGERWTRQQMEASRAQYEANLRASGLRPDGTARATEGGWLAATEAQMDGTYDAAAAQAARDRARAQGADPVTGQHQPSRWLRTMSERMTVRENPVPRTPPAPNPTWETLRARQVEEQRARAAEEERSRAGWVGVVERSVRGELDRVAAQVEERDRVAAERAAERDWGEREAAREERRAAAEERRREFLAGVAEEVQAELAAEARRERRLTHQRLVDEARVGTGGEFGDGWGGDAA